VRAANSTEALQPLVDGVAAARSRLSLDQVFPFEHMVEAHRYMEENRAPGKLVVLLEERPLP
jgi:NADPH:quinone reductase-like Zn-dependent oxidoreductase